MFWMLGLAAGALLLGTPIETVAPPPSATLWQPGLWALGASTSIYVGSAAMEGIHHRITGRSFARNLSKARKEYTGHRPFWAIAGLTRFEGALSLTVLGLNYSIYRYCRHDIFRNGFWLADSGKHNWTLLTCAFTHFDPKHLANNMGAIIPEIPHLLQACGQSPYQFVAFYLVAAISSSYAQRVVSSTKVSGSLLSYFGFPKRMGLGASGVAMAVFAASCFSQPWGTPSFVFNATTLGVSVMNDLEGLRSGKGSIGFAAHLAGAAFGAAYAYSNADYYLWRTLVRFFSGENNNKSRPKPPAQLDGTADLSLDQLVDRLNSSE